MKTAKLGDVADFIRGITFKPDDVVPLNTPGSIACLRTKNVQSELDLSDVWAVPASFVKGADRLTREGDMVMSTANSWNLVGKVSWIPKLEWEATVGGFVSLLRPRTEKIDARYLFRWIGSDKTQALLRSCARQTTNISNLSLSQAEALEIPLPPLEEQKRIAAILDQADALRRLRARALTRLNALGQAIFHEMFGDPVTNPMNWPKRPIGDLCSRVSVGVVVKPASYYQDDGVPAIRGTNIKSDGIDLSDLVYFSEEASNGPLRKSRLNTGDLVAVRSGRPGLSAVVPPELDGANCIDVLIATTKPELLSSLYLRDFLNSSGGKKLVLAESRGQVQQHFNVKSLSEGEIILPPIEHQLQYVERLAKLSEARLAASVADDREQALFSSLQNRAFRGEL